MILRKSCHGDCCNHEELHFGRLTPTKKSKRQPKITRPANGFLTDSEKKNLDATIRLNCNGTSHERNSINISKAPEPNGIVKNSGNHIASPLLSSFDCGLYKLKVLVADGVESVAAKKAQDYLKLSQEAKDFSKTGYTYANSWSYRKDLPLSQFWDWTVPNLSRMSMASFRKTSQSMRTDEEKLSAVSTHATASVSRSEFAVPSTPIRNTMRKSLRPRDESPFTRSQCRGGVNCEAGCEVHQKARRRQRSFLQTTVIPYSGVGIEPAMSDDTDFESEREQQTTIYSKTNGVQHRSLRDERHYDSGYENEDEDITVVKKITNIFTTSVNNASSSVRNANTRSLSTMSLCLFTILPILLCSGYFLVPWVRAYSLSSQSHPESASFSMSSPAVPVDNRRIDELHQRMDDVVQQLNRLSQQVESIKETTASREEYLHLKSRIDDINLQLTNCCRSETELAAILRNQLFSIFKSEGDNRNPDDLSVLLRNVIRQEVEDHNKANNKSDEVDGKINSIHSSLMKKVVAVRQKVETLEDDSKNRLAYAIKNNNLTLDQVKHLIRHALFVYDADKTGKPDYALESSGGTVVDIRCSETFDPYGINYRIFGIPLWSTSNSPRTVIQPTTTPGDCWAFKGSRGYLVIRLSQLIIPTSFSYEHIPKEISRDGNIKSAPREFIVRGLKDESDTEGELLGNYSYEDNGMPLQNFPVKDPNPKPYELIELVVMSNHGHEEYTCLYRFRVHGKRIHF